MPLVSILALLVPIAAHVPWNQLEDLAADVVDGKATRAELEASIPVILDAAIPLDQVVPGGLGAWLEKVDDDAFRLLVGWIADVATHRAKARKAPTASTPRQGLAATFAHLFHPKGALAAIAAPA